MPIAASMVDVGPPAWGTANANTACLPSSRLRDISNSFGSALPQQKSCRPHCLMCQKQPRAIPRLIFLLQNCSRDR
jgi:hypothetical protein